MFYEKLYHATFRAVLVVTVLMIFYSDARSMENTLKRVIRSPVRGESSLYAMKKLPHDYKQICGLTGSRALRSLSLTPTLNVLSGSCAPYGSYPWTVQIQVVGSGGYTHHCGGTILTEDIILTAAHCIDERTTDQLRAVVGQGYLNVNETEEMTFEIEHMVIHPQYNNPDGTISNDLALLKILRKGDGNGILFTDIVAPACLPLEDTPQKPGTECTISGWGRTDFQKEIAKDACLMYAVVPIVSDDQCRSWYSHSSMVWSNGMMCAGYEDGGRDSCEGDSGGPLACASQGRFYITGVVSKGLGCGQRKRPGIYTVVKNYLKWIEETILRM